MHSQAVKANYGALGRSTAVVRGGQARALRYGSGERGPGPRRPTGRPLGGRSSLAQLPTAEGQDSTQY